MKDWQSKQFTMPKEKGQQDGAQIIPGLGEFTPGKPFRAQHAAHAEALVKSDLFKVEDVPVAKEKDEVPATDDKKDGKK